MSDTPSIATIREQHENVDGFCYRCSMSWPCDSSLLLAALDAARQHESAEREARHGLWQDLADFAKTVHEQHHDEHSGTWLSCDRGTCPGVRRALARGSDDALALRAAMTIKE